MRPSPYVFATDPENATSLEFAEATVREAEGRTVVIAESDARALGIAPGLLFAWLTLTINSSLDAVGLTAAFSTALAAAGISCNVLAGYHHDHLLVVYDARDRAVEVLRTLR